VVKKSSFSLQKVCRNERIRLYGKANQVSHSVPVANRNNHTRAHGDENLDQRNPKASDKPAKIATRRVGLGPPINYYGGASPTLPTSFTLIRSVPVTRHNISYTSCLSRKDTVHFSEVFSEGRNLCQWQNRNLAKGPRPDQNLLFCVCFTVDIRGFSLFVF